MVMTTTLTVGADLAAASIPKQAKRKRVVHTDTERQPGIGKGIISHYMGMLRGDGDGKYANLSHREGPVRTGNLLPDFAEHRTGSTKKNCPSECRSGNDRYAPRRSCPLLRLSTRGDTGNRRAGQ